MGNSVFTYFSSLSEHEHICHIYHNETECYELAGNFLVHGTQSNNRCLFISDRATPSDLLLRLKGHGITRVINGGQKTFEEVIIHSSTKDSKKAQTFVRKMESTLNVMLQESNKPLRILMMHSDNCYFLSNPDRLWKGAYLNKMCLENPIILMNQYQINRLNSQDIISIFKTHPNIVEGNKIYKSPLYMNPESILQELEKESERFKELSLKEHKILGLIINGLSNSRIASELSISVKTVETHRANIMKKLKIHSLVDLVKFSMRNGLA